MKVAPFIRTLASSLLLLLLAGCQVLPSATDPMWVRIAMWIIGGLLGLFVLVAVAGLKSQERGGVFLVLALLWFGLMAGLHWTLCGMHSWFGWFGGKTGLLEETLPAKVVASQPPESRPAPSVTGIVSRTAVSGGRMEPAELLMRAKDDVSRRQYAAAGRWLDQLFKEYGDTQAAVEALALVVSMGEGMGSEAPEALRSRRHYQGWGGMAWGGSAGNVDRVTFSNVEAGKLLHEACAAAGGGDSGRACGLARSVVERYSYTPLAEMAYVRGLRWAKEQAGEAGRRETAASELAARAVAAVNDGRHEQAKSYWGQLDGDFADTFTAKAHVVCRRKVAAELLAAAERKASSNDLPAAVEVAWHVVRFYPESPSARVAAGRGSEWQRAGPSSLSDAERRAHNVYTNALSRSRQLIREDATAHTRTYRHAQPPLDDAIAAIEEVLSKYPQTFTAEIVRRDWQQRLLNEARSAVWQSDFDKAQRLSSLASSIFKDQAGAAEVQKLIADRKTKAEEERSRKAREETASGLMASARERVSQGDYDAAISTADRLQRDFSDTHPGRQAKWESDRWRKDQEKHQKQLLEYVKCMQAVRPHLKARAYGEALAVLQKQERDSPYDMREPVRQAREDVRQMQDFWASEVPRIAMAAVGSPVTLRGRRCMINAMSRGRLFVTPERSTSIEERPMAELQTDDLIGLRTKLTNDAPNHATLGLLLWAEGSENRALKEFGSEDGAMVNVTWRRALCLP